MATDDDPIEPGAPTEDTVELTYDVGSRSVRFELEEAVYPRTVIYGASYVFIDRCYVLLTRPADQRVGVQLKSKDAETTQQDLGALAGEFANELLNQLVRFQVSDATADIRKYYMARAFFGLTGNPSIDALLMELDEEELEDDELDISVPWEPSDEREEPGGGAPKKNEQDSGAPKAEDAYEAQTRDE